MKQQRELHPGQEVGGYILKRKIGTGGSGEVWEVQDAGGNSYALKLLHSQLALDETYRQRMRREAQLLARIHSPGVVAVYDFEVDAAESFIVTELIHGQSLRDLVQQQEAFSFADSLEIASSLLDTLDTVHGAGIVHRDFKPSNILLGADGPVLIDFGIAQAATDERFTATGLVSGTPGWVAPEVIAGQQPNALADHWGWAATLLYMLTGRPPYGTGSWEAVLARVGGRQLDTVGLPSKIGQLFQQALGSVEQRLPARELLESLAAAWNRQEFDTATILLEGATEPLQTVGTSSQFSPEESKITLEGPLEVETPLERGGENSLETPLENTLAKPRTPLLTAPLFYLSLALLPPVYGIWGIGAITVVMLLLAVSGYHRKYLRKKLNTYLEIKKRDRLSAAIRAPLHFLQAALGIGVSLGISQIAVGLCWYLIGNNHQWEGLRFYLEITQRLNPYPKNIIIPPELPAHYPFLILGGWFFSVITCLLGPAGKELNEGTSLMLTRLVPGKILRFIVVFLVVAGLSLWGVRVYGIV